MDILALLIEGLFEATLVVAGGLLLLAYLAFVRMNKDVRRARMFLMSDRVGRFLGAFTSGFLLVAAAAALSIAGLPTAETIFTVVIFFFLAAIVYGSLELFLIVRPRPARLSPTRGAASPRGTSEPPDTSQRDETAGGGGNTAR